MKIAKIIDQFGWAYYFLDKEQQKYSKHEIVIQKHNEDNLNNIDVVYIHGPDISIEARELCFKAKDLGIKVVGGHAGPVINLEPYPYLDLAVGISPQTFEYCKEHYKCPTIFLPEGIDTEFFKPVKRAQQSPIWNRGKWKTVSCNKTAQPLPIPSLVKRYGRYVTSLIVGWAGRRDNIKRMHLLEQLDFKVEIQSQHGRAFFVERTLDPMLRFYNAIDVLVMTSLSECMPRVVLEACSCGIPVVCTDVGSIRMILDPDWIVPVNPENVVVEEMNKKLHLLENKDLRQKVGTENRNRVEKTLGWKTISPYWDLAFESIVSNNFKMINTINRHFKME
ncbi:MAG: glycosyltransferase family 4 protein [Candidatus Cloacimonetes bacterium]|jgi:glycosyltransferase involved in cell wall biosynthesis|nr:glycosyltransferase family 4 protein [Candidatus Cloacimonadota bacterium]